MQTLLQSETAVNLAVIFNNGQSAVRPWQVVIKERGAIVEQLGSFSRAETAVMHANSLAAVSNAIVTIPAWLSR